MLVKNKVTSFAIICVAFIFMLFLSCHKVDAAFYDVNENGVIADSVSVSRKDNDLKVSLKYQNGIRNLRVYICNSDANCGETNSVTKFVDNELNTSQGKINSAPNSTATYVYDPAVVSGGLALNAYSDKIDENGKSANNYYVYVTATFCMVRSEDNSTCMVWDDSTSPGYTWGKYFDLDNGGFTGDSQINETLARMLNIINTIVIPVLWAILAVLLIVRGIMLGMDIVKSSDEPEVRKKKISGLIWLFIGVGVGYAVTIVANIIIGMYGFGGIF